MKKVILVLFGMGGVGKGEQAKLLSAATRLPHVSTGVIFRAHIKERTELGLLAQSYMSRGELVPDNVTMQMLQERLTSHDCRFGAILDGVPRTKIQVALLTNLLSCSQDMVTLAIYFTAPLEVIFSRSLNRLVCSHNAAHMSSLLLPGVALNGNCSNSTCSGVWKQRSDDTDPITIARRIDVFNNETLPVIRTYHPRVAEINCIGSIKETFEHVQHALEEHRVIDDLLV